MIKDAWEFRWTLGFLKKGNRQVTLTRAPNNLPMLAVKEALYLIQLTEQRRIICANLPGFLSGPTRKAVRVMATIPDATDVALKAVAFFRTLHSGVPTMSVKMTHQERADQREFVVLAVSAVAPEELGRAALRVREQSMDPWSLRVRLSKQSSFVLCSTL
jgi:hypothetical protein